MGQKKERLGRGGSSSCVEITFFKDCVKVKGKVTTVGCRIGGL